MDSDKVIEEYIYKHLEKIERFLQKGEPTPIDIDFTIVPSKTREHHKVEIRVKSPHYDLIADMEKEGTDFYAAVNHVIDSMYHQLLKAKDRRITERDHGGPQPHIVETEEDDKDEDEE